MNIDIFFYQVVATPHAAKETKATLSEVILSQLISGNGKTFGKGYGGHT